MNKPKEKKATAAAHDEATKHSGWQKCGNPKRKSPTHTGKHE